MTMFPFEVKRTFVAVALVFGVIFALITPPFTMPDEGAHFSRAFQVSEGTLLARLSPPERPCEVNCLGGELPVSLPRTRSVTIPLTYDREAQVPVIGILKGMSKPLNPQDRAFIPFSNIAIYPPIQYLPHALALVPLRLLGANPIIAMYGARLANLLVWTAMTTYAIHLMPVKKWFLAFAALTPMSLFLAAGAHGDPFINASAYVLIALVLRLRLEGETRITPGHAGLLLVLGLIISVSKIAYAPLVGLVLLIPPVRFESPRLRWAVMAGVPLVCAAATFGWSLVTNDLYSPRFEGPIPTAQLDFVLANPLTFLGVIGQTLDLYGIMYLREMIGVLGWLDVPLPNWLIWVYWVTLLGMALTHDDHRPAVSFPWGVRLYTLAVIVGSFLLVMLGVYAIWNPVGAPNIKGPQGRYFLMMVPLLVLLLGNDRLRLPFDGRWVALGVSAVALILSVGLLLVRYY